MNQQLITKVDKLTKMVQRILNKLFPDEVPTDEILPPMHATDEDSFVALENFAREDATNYGLMVCFIIS